MKHTCNDPRHAVPCVSEGGSCSACEKECNPACLVKEDCSFIVQTTDPNTKKPFYVVENGEMFLTNDRSKATTYANALAAECAMVFLPDGYKGKIVKK